MKKSISKKGRDKMTKLTKNSKLNQTKSSSKKEISGNKRACYVELTGDFVTIFNVITLENFSSDLLVEIYDHLNRSCTDYFDDLVRFIQLVLNNTNIEDLSSHSLILNVDIITENLEIEFADNNKERFLNYLTEYVDSLKSKEMKYYSVIAILFYITHKTKTRLVSFDAKVNSFRQLLEYGSSLYSYYKLFFNYDGITEIILKDLIKNRLPRKLIKLFQLNLELYGTLSISNELLIYCTIFLQTHNPRIDNSLLPTECYRDTLIKFFSKLSVICSISSQEIVQDNIDPINTFISENYGLVFTKQMLKHIENIEVCEDKIELYNKFFTKTLNKKIEEYIVFAKLFAKSNSVQKIFDRNNVLKHSNLWMPLLRNLKQNNLSTHLAYWCDKLSVKIDDKEKSQIISNFTSEITYMNLNCYKVRIKVIEGFSDLKNNLKLIFCDQIVAFDVKCSSHKPTGPSIIQLANSFSTVYIVDVIMLLKNKTPDFKNILQCFANNIIGIKETNIIIGYEIREKIDALYNLFKMHGIHINWGDNRMIDLAVVYEKHLECEEISSYFSENYDPTNKLSNFDRLIYKMIGFFLKKDFKNPNWDKRPLLDMCIQYAACKVYSIIKIYEAIRPFLLKYGISLHVTSDLISLKTNNSEDNNMPKVSILCYNVDNKIVNKLNILGYECMQITFGEEKKLRKVTGKNKFIIVCNEVKFNQKLKVLKYHSNCVRLICLPITKDFSFIINIIIDGLKDESVLLCPKCKNNKICYIQPKLYKKAIEKHKQYFIVKIDAINPYRIINLSALHFEMIEKDCNHILSICIKCNHIQIN